MWSWLHFLKLEILLFSFNLLQFLIFQIPSSNAFLLTYLLILKVAWRHELSGGPYKALNTEVLPLLEGIFSLPVFSGVFWLFVIFWIKITTTKNSPRQKTTKPKLPLCFRVKYFLDQINPIWFRVTESNRFKNSFP